MSLLRDLFISFGNPFLHHPDPSSVYLASASEPAMLRRDDQFDSFDVPSDPRGFLDSGDANGDGLRETDESARTPIDVLLAARGSLATLAPEATGVDVGGRTLADLDGDGIYDVGDGLVVNASEPFDDANDNAVWEPDLGETFRDVGLDGVPATGDFGEGNGVFDEDPDRASWRAEDPTSRLAGRSEDEIARQRLYMDVGTRDEFGFARHYENLLGVLREKGLDVDVRESLPGNCIATPDLVSSPLLVRYDGGHTGIPEADEIADQLLDGRVCGELIVWKRLLAMIGFLEESFPDGTYGLGRLLDFDLDIDFDDFDLDVDPNFRGEVVARDVAMPSLQAEGGEVPTRQVLVYRPPKFFGSDDDFPIVYFLVGYGQRADDYRRVGELLDYLILTEQVQNMFFVFVSGTGGRQGSFYVNHRIPEDQVPEIVGPTSGRYEDALLNDVLPYVENEIANGRIRS